MMYLLRPQVRAGVRLIRQHIFIRPHNAVFYPMIAINVNTLR